MKQTLKLKLGPQLAMTPRMRQAIRLLQLSTLELRGELRQILESNYMLEMDDELPGEEWGEEWGDGPVREDRGGGADSLPEPEESLRDQLFRQLDHARFSDEDYLIATAIIDAIDERGYLECSMDELLGALRHLGLPATAEEAEAVLQRVQRFEPPGVAARSLSECLLRQIEESPPGVPYRDLAMRIARNHLEEVARHDLAGLARRLRTTREELDGALSRLRTLNPRPGAGYPGRPTEYVTPDLRVFRAGGGEWRVEWNAGALPELRINPVYAQLVGRDDRGAENLSLRQHLAEARWLIRSLANRAETVLRVARTIVHRQSEFLEHGEEGMQPLVRRDIAFELDLHESTVSRVTSQKYLQTPRGVFELKYFFSNQVSTADGGGASAAAVQARLRKIIEREEPGRPRSDRRLASDLEQAGFRVARRTVAKYRESMGIPPSNERRRTGAFNLDASA